MNGASSNLAITAGSIGAAVSQGVSRTPASMSRSIQTYVPFFTPDGETMSERPAHGSFAKAGEVQESEEPDPREDRERDHQVFRVSVRNQDAWGHGDSHGGGTEEGDEPAVHRKPVREEIDETAARRRERQQEDERDEVEQPGRGDPKRRSRDPDDDRDHADHEDASYGRQVRGRRAVERRIGRPIPPGNPAACEDDPSEENEARRKQGEQGPPRLDVHVRQDRFSKRRRVPEPVHKRAAEEGAREHHLAFRARGPSPRTSEALEDDRPEDHDEEEV